MFNENKNIIIDFLLFHRAFENCALEPQKYYFVFVYYVCIIVPLAN